MPEIVWQKTTIAAILKEIEEKKAKKEAKKK